VALVGNALDHGAGRTPLPYRDHFDAHCGMEVVLANGEVVRTGMGAMPNSQLWQQTKYGPGPLLDGMFSQSNYGVVTKMGFWLMPEPAASMAGTVRLRHHDDLLAFVRVLSNLMYSNIVDCNFTVASPVFAAPTDADKESLLVKSDGGTALEWNRYAAARGMEHFWETELRFYGPPRIMAAKWEYVKERFATIPGATLTQGQTTHFPLSDAQVDAITDSNEASFYDIPSLGVFTGMARGELTGAPGGAEVTRHLDASPVVPISGEARCWPLRRSPWSRRLHRSHGQTQLSRPNPPGLGPHPNLTRHSPTRCCGAARQSSMDTAGPATHWHRPPPAAVSIPELMHWKCATRGSCLQPSRSGPI
jgi:(+)-pinoresinol hydroxylase